MKQNYFILLFLFAFSFGLFAQNVGIGTPQPDYLLDINGTLGVNDFIHHNDDTDTWMAFPDADQWEVVLGGRKMAFGDGVNQSFMINPDSDGVQFIILADGVDHLIHTDPVNKAIGIGTSTPIYLMDVAGDFRIMGDAVDHLFYASKSTNKIGFGTATPAYLLDVSGDFRIMGDAVDHLFFVDAASNKIGFGTSNPQHMIDVNGRAKMQEIEVGTNYLPFLNTMQVGVDTLTEDHVDAGSVPIQLTVNFPNAFSGSPPHITVSAKNLNPNSDNIFAVSVRVATTDYMILNVQKLSNSGPGGNTWTDDLEISWIAWQ